MTAEVAAVVVRWRGGDEVRRCLASLAAADEVVLVDNASADGGAEALAASFPQVRVEALGENRGFAGGVNHGVARTTAEMVLLLNPDAELGHDALQRLVRHLRSSPDRAGAAPALLGSHGAWPHRWQLRRLPTWLDLALGRPGRPAFRGPPDRPAPVAQPAAAAWLLRREVFEALDGLDAAYHPAWWEDVDFCRRLVDHDLGHFEVVPEATAVHIGGSSVASLGSTAFLAAFYANLGRYAARHHAHQVGRIRAGLRLSLAARTALRPSTRTACRRAFDAAATRLDPREADA